MAEGEIIEIPYVGSKPTALTTMLTLFIGRQPFSQWSEVGYKVRFLSNRLTDRTVRKGGQMNKLVCQNYVITKTTFCQYPLQSNFLGVHIPNREKRNRVTIIIIRCKKSGFLPERNMSQLLARRVCHQDLSAYQMKSVPILVVYHSKYPLAFFVLYHKTSIMSTR